MDLIERLKLMTFNVYELWQSESEASDETALPNGASV